MGRIRMGFRLAGASWRIVRSEPSLVAFPLLSAAAAIAYTLLVVLPIGIGGFLAFGDARILGWVLLAILLFGASVGATFFGVAAAHNANEALEGRNPTLGGGLRMAVSRLGVIVQWGLVSATVGLILQILADKLGGIGGAIVQGLGGLAWGIASFFALPILALEGLGPFATLKRSAGVVRERWGESLVGNAAIGIAVFVLVFLPSILVGVGGVLLLGSVEALGLALIAIACLGIAIGSLFSFTITTVFRVALYRYATEGKVIGGYDEQSLADAFTPRKKRRGHATA